MLHARDVGDCNTLWSVQMLFCDVTCISAHAQTEEELLGAFLHAFPRDPAKAVPLGALHEPLRVRASTPAPLSQIRQCVSTIIS
jgi:hypothetical protein